MKRKEKTNKCTPEKKNPNLVNKKKKKGSCSMGRIVLRC